MKPSVKNLLTVAVPILVSALLAFIIFWPYQHITLTGEEVYIFVSEDILTKNNIRPNTPVDIELINSYNAVVTISSSREIILEYDSETYKSSPSENDSSTSQFLKFTLPVVRGKIMLPSFSENTNIHFTSDNSYFSLTFYKPTEYLFHDSLIFIILIICISATALMARHALKN